MKRVLFVLWLMSMVTCLRAGARGGDDLRAGPMDSLFTLKDFKAARVSSHDRAGGNADAVVGILPGETRVLADIKGPGMITHIWCTTNCRRFGSRWIVLRMYWDDEETPSVEAPLGDFFCVGHGFRKDLWSLPFTVTSQGRARNCFFKMPFNKRARITLTNDGLKAMGNFYYYIDYRNYRRRFKDVGYFHAQYRQEYPCQRGKDYLVLDARGRGHYVGCTFSIEPLERGWWGEGDDKFYVDGEPYPSLHGTGTEDYLCDAWGMWPGFSPYYGTPLTRKSDPAVGNVSSHYRFHIEDPIPFDKSLVFMMEHYGASFTAEGKHVGGFAQRYDNISTVAYWYQTEPHYRFTELAPVDMRLPKTAERDIALLRFRRLAGEVRTEADLEALAPWREAAMGYAGAGLERDLLEIKMVFAELAAGKKQAAVRRASPFLDPFLNAAYYDDMKTLMPALGLSRSEMQDRLMRPCVVPVADGSSTVVEKAGVRCVRTKRLTDERYIYFRLPDQSFRNSDQTVKVHVTYYDEGSAGDTFQIQYDSMYKDHWGGKYRKSEDAVMTGEVGWHTHGFVLPRVRFGRGLNAETDFRIDPGKGGDVFIRELTVTAMNG